VNLRFLLSVSWG